MKKSLLFIIAALIVGYKGGMQWGTGAASNPDSTTASASASESKSKQNPPPSKSKQNPPSPKSAGSNVQSSAMVEVSGMTQEPELYNGCEVTSLSMLLAAFGHPVDKTELARSIAKDPSPQILDENENIISWGDPNVGFVGDVTGDHPGLGVYHGPVAKLLDNLLPGQAKDLTGRPFDDILGVIRSGRPVMVWTTVNFQPTSNWETWQGPNGPVKATFDEHAVLVVGYDENHVYLNDPLDGSSGKPVDRESFVAAWKQMGSQAVTIKGK
jgi:uncharacterized protein YvpB